MTVDPEGLCVANQPRLFKYFLRAVGQIETARDLTQDVFLRVSRAAVPQVPDGELRAWLFRIARNLALDHHRRHRHEPLAIRPALDPARASSQEVDAAVHEALASLPDLDRDVFLMREMAGLGYDEIAKACELTPDAVRSRIHRTRLQLRSLAQPKRSSGLRALLAAAAVLVALVGGYAIGQRQNEIGRSEPPPATRVVEAPAQWQVLP